MLWILLTHLLEFLVGWIVLPKVFIFFALLLLAYLGFPDAQSLLVYNIGKFLFMVLLLLVRRMVALGYVADYVLEILHIDISLDKLIEMIP